MPNYQICWKLSKRYDEEQLAHAGPSVGMDKQHALNLAGIGNQHFRRARHWVEEVMAEPKKR